MDRHSAPYEPERRALARAVPLAVFVLGMLGCIALVGFVMRPAHAPTMEHIAARQGGIASNYSVASTSITPITSVSDPASGFPYSGESYNVACTITGGSVVLYPAVHDGTRWQVFQGLPCPMDSATAAEGTCPMPAPLSGSGLTWNVLKTGTGTLSACTASPRSGPAPATRPAPSSGGGGTITSIDCDTGLICTPDPITTTGMIAPDFGTAAGKVVQGGVVTGATCAYPASVVYNAAGQVTACTAGSAPAVTGLADPTASVGLAAVNGVATTAMRSDAAPALSQGIVPTWTGAHTWLQPAVGTAQTPVVTLQNTTAAAAGAQQYSPGLVLEGRGWISGAGESRTTRWLIQERPVQGSAVVGHDLVFFSELSGGGYVEAASVGSFSDATTLLLSSVGGATSSVLTNGPARVGTLSSTLALVGLGGITLSHDTTLAANRSLVAAAGTGALNFGSGTGDWSMPTGTGSWAGAANKGLSLVAGTSGAITITARAASTWRTSSGALTLDGVGIKLQRGLSTLIDVGATTSTAVTLASGVTLNSAVNFVINAGTGVSVNTTGANDISLNTGASGLITVNPSGSIVATFNSGGLLLAAGKTIAASAGAGGITLSTMTGTWSLPSGTGSIISARVNMTQTAVTGAAVNGYVFVGGLHTALTASTEKPDWNWNGARTVQFATGALTTQRQYLFQPATYAFVGASTLTNAATVAISGAPVAGTNAILTNSYALWVQDGASQFDGLVRAAGATATPAGGSAAASLRLGTTAGLGIYYGSGAPSVSAAQGSIYLRTDGTTTNDRMYVNTNGSTGWTAVTTAS